MLLVAGLIVSVALVGLVVLGALCVGLWRRVLALVSELAALGDQLETVRRQADHLTGPPGGLDLDRDLATFRERHPEFEVEVRPRG